MKQWNFALFLCEMQSTSIVESTSAIDGWPSLLHHNYVSTTTFIENLAETFAEALRLSSYM